MESKNELITLKNQNHYCEINEMMGLSMCSWLVGF